ncbi:AraC family transcriptional regulator [Mesobacillus maritimus]|uniref:AraC family transcriptional regulator n=1 Tax=Mesobacillus maritimus TaxID=1643336 RepID=A0ABS7K091_9BACI|nr:AraC family transcriptional regulator [Mesobacillus maritimus]MBY0095667.1 AraC family transcriptional regulator [Mesobacillus maritimus]
MLFSFNDKELDFICSMIQENTALPIMIGSEGRIIKEFAPNYHEHPLIEKHDIYVQLLDHIQGRMDIPIIKTVNKLEYYLCIHTKDKEERVVSFLIGPCLVEKVTQQAFYHYIESYKIPRYAKDPLHAYLQSLPIYTKFHLSRIGQLFYYLLYRTPIDPSEIIEEGSSSGKLRYFEDDMEFIMSKKRAEEKLHHDNLAERKLHNWVKEGLTEEIKEFFSSTTTLDGLGTVTKNNPVRNDKNLGITMVALASRAAMDGGLHSEIAYTVSDMFIQRIEDDPSFKQLLSFTKEVFLEYADLVRKMKTDNFSKTVVSVQQYIYNHLYTKIDLETLAEHVHLHPNYLSRLFKQQVGVTISEYILQEKAKEAKNWLAYSELTITEIANQLNFHDQSHFIKTFKRIYGITPKQYQLKKH